MAEELSSAGSRQAMAQLQREADRICFLILSTDLTWVDILIEVNKLRLMCEELFPGREELFDMIYASRFERLWEQFGAERPGGSELDDAR